MIALIYALDDELKPILRRYKNDPSTVLCRTGIGMANAHEAAERLIDQFHPERILSAGFCGGLQNHLKTGDLILPTEIRNRGQEIFPVDHPDMERLTNWAREDGFTTYRGRIVTTFDPLRSPEEKREAGRDGSLGVDLESAAIAGVCQKKGVPLSSIRVVYDQLEMGLAGFDPLTVLKKNFFQIPKLIRMKWQCQKILGQLVGRWITSLP